MRIDAAARTPVLVLSILAAGAALLLPWWTATVPLALLAFTVWFFRDPPRETPDDPDALICPADGRIIRADSERLSVFMNVFDVHVCRAPSSGRVRSVEPSRGRFLAAFRDAASEHNERTRIELDGARNRISFTLIAGLIARRIVCRVAPGQDVAAGQRVGLIRFGSRVDLDVPPGAVVTAKIGDRVVAGETILARLAQSPPARATTGT